MLVWACQNSSHLGLSRMGENQETRLPCCEGPLCWSGHYHLYRPKYSVYVNGAASRNRVANTCSLCRKSGKHSIFGLFLFLSVDSCIISVKFVIMKESIYFLNLSHFWMSSLMMFLLTGVYSYLHCWNDFEDYSYGPILLFSREMEYIWQCYCQLELDGTWAGKSIWDVCSQVVQIGKISLPNQH